MSSQECDENVTSFLKQIVEKLTPAVAEAVARGASGTFEVHYFNGKYQRVIRTEAL